MFHPKCRNQENDQNVLPCSENFKIHLIFNILTEYSYFLTIGLKYITQLTRNANLVKIVKTPRQYNAEFYFLKICFFNLFKDFFDFLRLQVGN